MLVPLITDVNIDFFRDTVPAGAKHQGCLPSLQERLKIRVFFHVFLEKT